MTFTLEIKDVHELNVLRQALDNHRASSRNDAAERQDPKIKEWYKEHEKAASAMLDRCPEA